jgi:NAD dependent epimerase/dehydratase family enzyme
MRIVVSGSHGMVGTALLPALAARGHEVIRLVRSPVAASPEIPWDPQAGRLDPASLSGVEAVIHLAGENIASKRWSDEQKKRIRESRVKGTSLLAETMAGLAEAPRVFISSSAIGYYGDRATRH